MCTAVRSHRGSDDACDIDHPLEPGVRIQEDPPPARATVRAELLFGMKVEIQGIAFIPEG